MKSRIDRIGFELEGFWSEKTSKALISSVFTITTDRSLSNYPDGFTALELLSPPATLPRELEMLDWLDDLIATENEEKSNYAFNSSCGFHVHCSFFPKLPPEFASQHFVRYFHEQVKKKLPKVWEKRRTNSYCLAVTEKNEKIAAPIQCDRHRAVNFYALHEHGTIEFRIFPADHISKLKEYILFTVETIQSFLDIDFQKKIAGEVSPNETCKNVVLKSQAVSLAPSFCKLFGRGTRLTPQCAS